MTDGLNSYMYEYFRRGYYRGESQFGEAVTVQRTPIIELNSSYGTSTLRDVVTATGSASQTASNGEIVLSTGATASSRCMVESAEIGRYIPGYGAEIGVGVRFASGGLPDGTKEVTWGGMSPDENNALYFGYDSTGLYVARKVGGTVTDKTYQNNFNLDKVDGSGTSGYALDFDDGHIFQVQFTWYGYGQIIFGVLAVVDHQQTFIPLHEFSGFSSTSIRSPNLRIFVDAQNNDETSDQTVYVGGRQYSIIGNYIPKFRFTGDFRGSVATSTTVKPLITFRRKSGFDDRSIKLSGYDAVASTEPCIIQIRLDGSLTGASFAAPTNYTAAETALESDTSATAITGGEVLWAQLISAGQNKNSAQLSQESVDFDIPNGSKVTLCARTVSGTGTILSSLRMREEW